jgi:hypothetical protein
MRRVPDEFVDSSYCCGQRDDCRRCPEFRKRFRSYSEAMCSTPWAGDADDRSTFNLGNGGRRIPSRGSHD